MSFIENTREFLIKYRKISYPVIIILIDLIASLIIGQIANLTYLSSLGITTTSIIILYLIYRLYSFYVSPKRLEHEFNAFYASNFLSNFYRIYFPVIILNIIAQVFIGVALLFGLLDPDLSPTGFISLIASGIITGIGIIALSDYEMKRKNLLYSSREVSKNLLSTFSYMLPLLGLYFGFTFFSRFVLTQIFGPGALIPSASDVYQLDSEIIRAARFWQFLTETERSLTLVAFVVIYVGMEVFLRGYIGNEAKAFGLGSAAIVLIPAILQAFAFSNATFLFTNTVYYLNSLTEAFILGSLLGILMWRTGRFTPVVIMALLARLLDSRTDFQSTALFMLPEAFGEYNPTDAIVTTADTIGLYLIYFQIALVVISPFILIVGYEEVWRVIRNIYSVLRRHWFGYLVLAIAFFVIDLVFSVITSFFGGGGNIGGIILAFVIALLILRFVLGLLFQILPQPLEQPTIHVESDMFGGELPLNVEADITYLERSRRWYEYPRRVGVFGALFFVYFLFISATYRQILVLEGLDIVRFVFFLVILPTILIGITSYLYSRAHTEGYFFAENWRTTLFWILGIIFLINILIWTSASSTTNFQWRNVPLFVAFALVIWPKTSRNPVRDFAVGFAKSGRYATFRWIENNQESFQEQFEELIQIPSENVKVGSFIAAGQYELIEEWNLIETIRSSSEDRGALIGSILALGYLGTSTSETVLLDFLRHDDTDVVMASYWTLGRIGSKRSLNRMAKILEENPKRSLVKVGERAILNIDPNFPLAGIRDSIVVDIS